MNNGGVVGNWKMNQVGNQLTADITTDGLNSLQKHSENISRMLVGKEQEIILSLMSHDALLILRRQVMAALKKRNLCGE